MADKKENIEYAELKKAISAKSLKPLYVLWGEESYLKEYYFKEFHKAMFFFHCQTQPVLLPIYLLIERQLNILFDFAFHQWGCKTCSIHGR